MSEASISIILVHWKIRKNSVSEFESIWKTGLSISNRDGLVGEFLSKVERRDEEHPYITWAIPCEDPALEENCVHYINIAIWNSHKRFFEEVGKDMNDTQPIKDYEIERRRRVTVTPREWRVAAGLPASDSDGTL